MASTLIERVIGAVRLDAATYEEVEADPTAMTQAMIVVVMASLAAGIGASVSGAGGSVGMIRGTIGALIGWFVWAATVYFIGTRLLPGPDTQADLGQLLRTTGFSAAPGVIGILGIVPGIGGPISLVAGIWQLAAMVVAVRQALDYETTGRAVLVCVVGFVAYVLVFALILGGLFGAANMPGGGPATVTP